MTHEIDTVSEYARLAQVINDRPSLGQAVDIAAAPAGLGFVYPQLERPS